ncbi:hypothetical protein WBG78_23640 [Chryseolinea sp. T2]|uniref:hypothetical protein n=1 Tax=Chryseolinea sp. T2 TaxID=3129255 RepID=UPI003076A76B
MVFVEGSLVNTSPEGGGYLKVSVFVLLFAKNCAVGKWIVSIAFRAVHVLGDVQY